MLHPYGNLTCIWQQYWAKIAFWVQNKTYNVVHFTYNGFNKIHWPSLHTYNIFLFPDRHDLILSFKWLKDICLVKGFINKQVQPVFADYTFDVLSCWIPLRYILCNSLNGLPRSNPCIPAATLEKDMDLSYNISYGKGAMLSFNHVQKMLDLKHLFSQQYSNFIPNNYLIVKARKSANKGCCCCCRQLSAYNQFPTGSSNHRTRFTLHLCEMILQIKEISSDLRKPDIVYIIYIYMLAWIIRVCMYKSAVIKINIISI